MRRLTARQVNLLLEVLVVAALVTGAASWVGGDRWSRWLTFGHAVAGLMLLVLAPAKLRGSVATGFRRRRSTRWVSATFGTLVVATAVLGVLHATGWWFGVGAWTALWTHVLVAVVLIPFFLWHLLTRPVRPRRADIDRRAFVGTATTAAAAVAVYGAQEVAARTFGWAGGDRRGSGSHEVGSGDPAAMPTVSWIDDVAPADTTATAWRLVVDGTRGADRRPLGHGSAGRRHARLHGRVVERADLGRRPARRAAARAGGAQRPRPLGDGLRPLRRPW